MIARSDFQAGQAQPTITLLTMSVVLSGQPAAPSAAVPLAPLARAMRWQWLLTAVAALIAGWLAGWHGVWSALLGGGCSFAGSLAFRWVAARHRGAKPMDAVLTMIKAEGAKLGVMVVLLLLVFASYASVVALALIGTFVATTLVFATAAFAAPARVAADTPPTAV